MKRAIAALLCCLILSGAGLGLAAHRLQATADRVTVEVTGVQGDPAAAQGLTVWQQANFSYQGLCWDLTIPLDNPAETTARHWTAEPLSFPWDWPAEGIQLSFALLDSPDESAFPISFRDLEAGYSSIHPLLAPMIEELAAPLAPEEEATLVISPQDYLTCYPLRLTLADGSPLLTSSDGTVEGYVLSGPLATFFSFPLSQEETWTVHLGKDKTGRLSALEITSSQPFQEMNTLYAQGKEQVFFTFTPAEGESLPSFDQVPGGYGIYRLAEGPSNPPWRERQIQADCPELVYPLSPEDGAPVLLALSPEEDTLFLVTRRGDSYACTLVDTAAKTCRQTFPLPMAPTQIVIGERTCLFCDTKNFLAYTQDEDGTFHRRWSAPLPQGTIFEEACNLRAAWNGEKLALGLYEPELRFTGLTLLIYDADGSLLYQGAYSTSLNQVFAPWHWEEPTETYPTPVYLAYEPEAFTLTWEK